LRSSALILVSSAILTACAGSATHKVVSAHDANDETISCKQIDAEIVRAQVIVDGVNKDKDDINGADWVDGILWFPFNLIAKNSNYKDALDAADKRMERLAELKKEKNCQSISTETAQYSASLANEIDKLNTLYKNGSISADEYKQAKAKLLGMTVTPKEETAQLLPATTPQILLQGSMAYSAEQLAKDAGCITSSRVRPYASPLQVDANLEVYDIQCTTQHMIVRCEGKTCKLMK